jgi:hypothetical protein
MHQRAAAEWAALMLITPECLMREMRLSLDLREIAAHLRVDLPTSRTRLRGLTDAEQDEWMAAIQRS